MNLKLSYDGDLAHGKKSTGYGLRRTIVGKYKSSSLRPLRFEKDGWITQTVLFIFKGCLAVAIDDDVTETAGRTPDRTRS